MDSRSHYLSYLLRLWQTPSHGEPHWLASLENPGTGERRGFPSLKALFAFLKAQAREEEFQQGVPPAPEISRPAGEPGAAHRATQQKEERAGENWGTPEPGYNERTEERTD